MRAGTGRAEALFSLTSCTQAAAVTQLGAMSFCSREKRHIWVQREKSSQLLVPCLSCHLFSLLCVLGVRSSLWPPVALDGWFAVSFPDTVLPWKGAVQALEDSGQDMLGSMGGGGTWTSIWMRLLMTPVIISLRRCPQRGKISRVTCKRHLWVRDTQPLHQSSQTRNLREVGLITKNWVMRQSLATF